MHLHFEKNADTKCDCSILSLSWMGKVPDNIPADEGWKLSRVNYYQEGWLATGNMRGTVGVTFTSSNNKKIPGSGSGTGSGSGSGSGSNSANGVEPPQRSNFNLRGHRSDVILCKWNEPYQKLASCDSTGIIFVWIKYEGRWSIELINDRNCPVTHFSWSHDGRMALICYQDGFVLVGSVSGQRYWSSMLNLESTITCGIWTPDDQQVYFGTTLGQIIVMDVHGAMVSQVQVLADVGIVSMAWSCEKFKMEEDEEMEPGVANATKRSFVLAVSFSNGFIYLMKSFDDLAPTPINTEFNGSLGIHMEWSNSRELLAVAGTVGGCYHAQTQTGRPAPQRPMPTPPNFATSRSPSPLPPAAAAAAGTAPTFPQGSEMHVRFHRGPRSPAMKSIPMNHDHRPIITGMQGTHASVVGGNVAAAAAAAAGPRPSSSSSTSSASSSSSSSTSTSSVAYTNMLKFYTPAGQLLFAVAIPGGPHGSPVSAMTWGHSDKRLFVATGARIHIAWVSRRVASLQMMCRLQVQRCIGPEEALTILPLPSKIKSLIGQLYAQTIRCSVPNAQSLREYVSRPPAGARLHCTMIRHDEDPNANTGVCYTLYLEYLGGLVPLLKGKRTSKIRPEFVIFDPQDKEHVGSISITGSAASDKRSNHSSSNTITSGSAGRTDTSDSDGDCEFGRAHSPRPNRRRKGGKASKQRHHSSGSSSNNGHAGAANSASAAAANPGPTDGRTASLHPASAATAGTSNGASIEVPSHDDELAYVDTLPEDVKLVEVNSNIWGTKFKIHGIAKNLPANLGQISYKTSLLHLQPRQMTVVVTELREDLRPEPDPHFNPHIFSEDEDDAAAMMSAGGRAFSHIPKAAVPLLQPPLIPTTVTPATVATVVLVDVQSPPSLSQQMPPNRPNRLQTPRGPLAKAESYEDDSIVAETTITTPPPAGASSTSTPAPAAASSSSAASFNKAFTATYISLFSQNSRSSSNSSGSGQSSGSRHAISPLCSDGGVVPALQSPTNAAAPADIIFDRPPPTGLHSLSGSDSKPHLSVAAAATITTASNGPRKRSDLQFIDEDVATSAAPASAAVVEPIMHRTPTLVSIAPAAIVRSCSVGYLDSVEIIPSDVSLSILRREAPHKRLVLVDKIPATATTAVSKTTANGGLRNGAKSSGGAAQRRPCRKKPLVECGKSRSLDSCDLQQVLANRSDKSGGSKAEKPPASNSDATTSEVASTTSNGSILPQLLQPLPLLPMPRVHEASETEDSSSDVESSGPLALGSGDTDFLLVTYSPTHRSQVGKSASVKTAAAAASSSTTPPASSRPATSNKPSQPFCIKCRILSRECHCKHSNTNVQRVKKENVTSFADSPLFTRKHRFGEDSAHASASTSRGGGGGPLSAPPRTPQPGKKHEFSFSFLKQLTESRRRKREAEYQAEAAAGMMEEREVHEQIDVQTDGGGAGGGRDGERTGFVSLHSQALSRLEHIISRLKDLEDSGNNGRNGSSSGIEVRLPRSSPASPAMGKKKRNPSSSPIRQILNSPLLNRRNRKKQLIESSDEESPLCPEQDKQPLTGGGGGKKDRQPYQDLETFQKAQLRQKLKRGKIEPNGMPSVSQPAVMRREFVMHNKAPMWNENSQVYQLDFGGRVTQESAKNFQIEFRGQQVMQFGRIDGNAYTLDFQYPFSALQAFSVALANVTQRLK